MAKIFFYYSAMNAGKSTTLLQSNYNYLERGMSTLIFTPKLDDRYGVGKISSRIGLSAPAVIFDDSFDFFSYVETHAKKEDIHCILIDEAQFLSKKQVWQLTDIADNLNIPVLCYGIRTDSNNELFEGSKYLLAWAEELIEIKTICHCGRKAITNARLDENGEFVTDGQQVAIGNNYISLCRRHFKLKQVKNLDSDFKVLEEQC